MLTKVKTLLEVFPARKLTIWSSFLHLQKEQNTLTFYGFDTQMAKLYTRAVYSEIRKRLKLSTLFTATETEEPTKYLVRYNHPQKLSVWAQHAFQVVADPVGETYECECRLWDHTGEECKKDVTYCTTFLQSFCSNEMTKNMHLFQKQYRSFLRACPVHDADN